MHQLRQPPDLPDALSLPLPLHLAGLAQEYVLPVRAEDESQAATDPVADNAPEAGAAPGVADDPETAAPEAPESDELSPASV